MRQRWVKDEKGREQYTYYKEDMAYITYHYEDYCLTKGSEVYWIKNRERLLETIDTKIDFDRAKKKLSPRKQGLIDLIIKEEGLITDRQLEQRGFYEAKDFKWAIFGEMAGWLNGG